MITQKSLAQILNAEAEVAKINAEIGELCKPMTDKLASLQASIDAKKKEILEALLAKDEVESGKRFAELKETKPRASVSWKEVWETLATKHGLDIKTEAEKLAEKSKEGKKSTFSLIVK